MVVPEPRSARPPRPPSAAPAAAAATLGRGPSRHDRRNSAAARQGGGLGNAQGPGRLRRRRPRDEDSRRKGQGGKDPEVCAKDGPIKSERLIVDAATKGVKNVLVYLPKPTG